jgi:hypothetical protein
MGLLHETQSGHKDKMEIWREIRDSPSSLDRHTHAARRALQQSQKESHILGQPERSQSADCGQHPGTFGSSSDALLCEVGTALRIPHKHCIHSSAWVWSPDLRYRYPPCCPSMDTTLLARLRTTKKCPSAPALAYRPPRTASSSALTWRSNSRTSTRSSPMSL